MEVAEGARHSLWGLSAVATLQQGKLIVFQFRVSLQKLLQSWALFAHKS
jgi:hypothetical protein